MKTKSVAPKVDPETAARTAVEEARAEADKTSATQGLLKRRTRRTLRVFGARPGGNAARGFGAAAGGGGGDGGGSGSAGVPGYYDPFPNGFNPGVGDYGGFFY